MLDGLQKIYLHLNSDYAGSRRGGQERCESACRIRQHGQNAATHYPVDLLMEFQHGHHKYGPPALRLHQLKAEVVDGIAVAQALGGPRQIGFRQFSLWLHSVWRSLRGGIWSFRPSKQRADGL